MTDKERNNFACNYVMSIKTKSKLQRKSVLQPTVVKALTASKLNDVWKKLFSSQYNNMIVTVFLKPDNC